MVSADTSRTRPDGHPAVTCRGCGPQQAAETRDRVVTSGGRAVRGARVRRDHVAGDRSAGRGLHRDRAEPRTQGRAAARGHRRGVLRGRTGCGGGGHRARSAAAGATSATEAARSSAEVLATVNERSHGVWMAFSEASRNDEVLSAELRRLTEEIAEQTRIALEQWRAQGWLRQDLPVAELVRRAGGDRLGRAVGPLRPGRGPHPAAYRELIAGLLLDALNGPGRGR